MDSPILKAYILEEGAKVCNVQEISRYLKDDVLAWVHLDVNHPDTKDWIKREVSYLDPFVISALLADETRPRITQVCDGAVIILRGVNLNENADPEDMISIRLWVDAHRIISLQKRPLKAIADLSQKIEAGKGPSTAGLFTSTLISRLFERMEPVLSSLDEDADTIEEHILENADTSQREQIIDVRKRAILLRRYMAPQRDAIGQLRNTDLSWLTDINRRQLLEDHNRVTRYIEDLDTIRERAQIIKDELANILADQLNKNMYVLSVIAAVFLPLGFLTGLLGINVGGIPGSENTNSFWIFCVLLVVLVALQVLIFKKLKWF